MPVANAPLYPYGETGITWVDSLLKGMQKDPYSISPGQAGIVYTPDNPFFQLLKYATPRLADALKRMNSPIRFLDEAGWNAQIVPKEQALGNRLPWGITIPSHLKPPNPYAGYQSTIIGISPQSPHPTQTTIHEALHALYLDKFRYRFGPPSQAVSEAYAPSILGKYQPMTDRLLKQVPGYADDPGHLALEVLANNIAQRSGVPIR